MTNVLLTFESVEPTNKEAYKIFSEISRKGYIKLRSKRCIEITTEDLDWCDIILSVRSASSLEASLAEYAKELGKYWILMLDDDFFSLGRDYGQDGQGYREEKKDSLKKVLKYTDCLMTLNQHLIEKYSKYGNMSRTYKFDVPTEIDHLVPPQKQGEKTKIVYYVNDGTTTMIDRYLRPVFYKLAELYKGKVSLYFMAVHPNLHELDEALDIHYVPHMSFEEFLEYVAAQHFDIGLAPLDDIGFSKFKYINKYVEYTRAGTVGVYSDCELYRTVVVSGENGLLCENTVDSWISALGKLIEDPDYKVKLAEGAQEYVRNHMTKESVVNGIVEAIPELKTYKAPKKKASASKLKQFHMQYWMFRVRGWAYTVNSCIRSGNVKGLFRRAVRKMTEKY